MSAPGQHCDNQAEREPGERAADRQHLPHNDCGDTLPGTIPYTFTTLVTIVDVDEI